MLLQLTFTAQAGPPVRLEPESVPPTPTVSNTSRITGRCLVKTLKLQLKVCHSVERKTVLSVSIHISGDAMHG